MAKVKHVVRSRRLVPEEAAKYRRIREKIAAELPEIRARGREILSVVRPASKIFQELKAIREAKGLSLAEVGELSGMDRSFISKLETGVYTNFTLQTLERYARSLGKHLEISLSDADGK